MKSGKQKKAVRLLSIIFVLYAVLVATHLGEFWPFSIYPMFSQAGNPWSRSIVYETDPRNTVIGWESVTREQLQGEQFPLNRIGLAQNDLSNLIQKNTDWSPPRLEGIRRFFGEHLEEKGYILYRARGDFADGTYDVVIDYTPYLILLPDTTLVNPILLTDE